MSVGIMASAVHVATGTTTFPTLATTNTEVGAGFVNPNAIPAPAGIVAGDLLVAFVTNDGGETMTASTGWTAITNTVETSNHAIHVFGRVADGGANDALTLTRGGGVTTADYCASTHRITGHGVATVATDIKAAGNTKALSTNPNPPSLDAGSSKHWLWLTACGWDQIGGSEAITAAPANYTMVVNLESAATSNSSLMAVAQRSLQTQTEDPGTFTSTATGRNWVAVTIAIPGT